jgi:hypothetical protein
MNSFFTKIYSNIQINSSFKHSLNISINSTFKHIHSNFETLPTNRGRGREREDLDDRRRGDGGSLEAPGTSGGTRPRPGGVRGSASRPSG